MPYPEQLVQPMREELTRLGVEELRTPDEVDAFIRDSSAGTALVVLNSVCGCAAANARPAVAMARRAAVQPDRFATVFAGQDVEATQRLRQHLTGIPPSSPFMALFQNGEPVFVVERRHIEGRSASAIAADLVSAFEANCSGSSPSSDEVARPLGAETPRSNDLPDSFRSIL